MFELVLVLMFHWMIVTRTARAFDWVFELGSGWAFASRFGWAFVSRIRFGSGFALRFDWVFAMKFDSVIGSMLAITLVLGFD